MSNTPNEHEFFNRLLLLPLFQGIGRNEFQEIARSIRIGFRRINREHTIVRQEELCTQLHFVLDGKVCISREGDGHQYALTEWYDQPMVIMPEVLFGLTTRYTRTFTTSTAAELLVVDKAAVRDLLFNYPTFRINYINLVSTQVQQAQRQIWHMASRQLSERFVQFVTCRCLRPAGHKRLKIKRPQLALELRVSKLIVSQMLTELEAANLLIIRRGYIDIPCLELLQAYLRAQCKG